MQTYNMFFNSHKKKKRMGVWRFDYNGITKLNQGEINMYKPKKGY